ncbi:uncharacterized protein LOC110386044 isoform X1 [Bombyx mori]|uniref:Uncharacterized protein n=1 Tax=Bombyx mori TaxID=7091 RepID=A0A8R2QWC3_BOMMO|nr:uncharacterized protein LOC110386044 isoform X1 [Bombyx mori]XP_037868889.1 uncharacterized protein LOC110386044 isoform X1 [Bombyx mori]
MKRKLCTPPFNCDDMEELNVTALSRRKESAAPLTGEREGTFFHQSTTYPFALVLRLRVLQIVCGISAMVMGSVAFIEERQKFNMGLGIPAGGLSVLAAAVSIHTSRGWSTVSGVAGAGAGAASVLWAAATCLLLALIVQCCRTILDPPGVNHSDGPQEEESQPSSRDLVVIACVQIALALATLLSAAVCARIDCGS